MMIVSKRSGEELQPTENKQVGQTLRGIFLQQILPIAAYCNYTDSITGSLKVGFTACFLWAVTPPEGLLAILNFEAHGSTEGMHS